MTPHTGMCPERSRHSIEKKDFPVRRRDLDCAERIVSRHNIARDIFLIHEDRVRAKLSVR